MAKVRPEGSGSIYYKSVSWWKRRSRMAVCMELVFLSRDINLSLAVHRVVTTLLQRNLFRQEATPPTARSPAGRRSAIVVHDRPNGFYAPPRFGGRDRAAGDRNGSGPEHFRRLGRKSPPGGRKPAGL